MSAVSAAEVRPGLVVHLDTAVLRRRGGSVTNAERTPAGDRAVVGPHYFLVLDVDAATDTVTAVPLFSTRAPGSELLDPHRKGGSLPLWRDTASYYSRWQHWRIPMADLVAASVGEVTGPADRCRWSDGDSAALAAIAGWAARNRSGFRPA